MKHPRSIPPRPTSRQFVLSSIALAVLSLAQQAQAQQADAPMQRVEVTGSSIKRLAAEEALPVTTIKADELVKQGMTTLADVMMALPQSASLQPSNAGSGTNINLRGLGVNRTLVLLNGRRLANEAIADGYANLDTIPISALQRVEVLRDGASSIYGSDAIGGVVNFITKREVEGGNVTVQLVHPQRRGGGDEQRIQATFGKGNLERDSWNVYGTVDFHQRSRLLLSDRAGFVPDAAAMTAIGLPPGAASGGYATPANFTSAANKNAANPYYASGCLSPYSIQGAKNTCVLNNDTYGTALYPNKQLTMYAKVTRKIDADNTVTVEYTRGDESIFASKTPTQALAVGARTPILPSTSKWYPGKSGGVPAVPGITNQPLTVSWAVADFGPAVTRDNQINQRLLLSADGHLGNWDYKAGMSYGLSLRKGYYKSGYFSGIGLINGLANGVLNPFGLQDQAGRDYLESIAADGMQNRSSKSAYYGFDGTVSRSLMALAGGDLAFALGADLHRDTNEDTKLAQAADITYAKSVPAHGESARNVAGIYTEIDAPVTKTLDLNGALRIDKYSDVGSTVTPKISFRWQPTKTIMFRGSANTGFRAPTLFDRYGYRTTVANTTTAARWDDPVLCPGPTPAIPGTGTAVAGANAADVCNAKLNKLTGSNNALQPERSKGGTLGVVFEPSRSFTASFDYWQVNMKDMLANPPENVYFTNYADYKNLFVRNPDGSLAYINNTTMNLGGQIAGGVDVSANWEIARNTYGTFGAAIDGTYLTHFDNQLVPNGPWMSNVGQFGWASNGTTSSFPIITFRWKHNLRLTWQSGDYSAQLTNNFNSHYRDANTAVTSQYYRDIPSYSTWNLTGSVRVQKQVRITAGVTNLFDKAPPITNNTIYSSGYLSSVANPTGRTWNLRVSYDFD
ncbi:TonB-dependent receptor [Massilia putida]|uniref:TonB-dependent receptor n=1 Tax=Massilia putida TaxID=1141883 RepID=UPI0009529A52|nr:TonB-dependent receptor [Massilia putida]